jgi:hypothetical protein
MLENSLMVISVRVNQTGPYDFLVDTGAQLSTIDTSLAGALHLKAEGLIGVSGMATHTRSPYTYLGSIEVGRHSATNSPALVQDLTELKAEDPRIQGILGDTFLEHFDLLMDYRLGILCIDDGKTLARAIKARHVPLAQPRGPIADLPFTRPLEVSASLNTITGNSLLLRLDSGSSVPALFVRHPEVSTSSNDRGLGFKRMVNGVEQGFAVTNRLDIQIGTTVVHKISFAVPLNKVGDGPDPREDGVLPTFVFQRIFISCSDGYVVLEP